MDLNTWLTENRVTHAALGRKVGVSGEHISRIANRKDGGDKVSVTLALAIHRETGVKVGPLNGASIRDLKAVARVLGERAA